MILAIDITDGDGHSNELPAKELKSKVMLY